MDNNPVLEILDNKLHLSLSESDTIPIFSSLEPLNDSNLSEFIEPEFDLTELVSEEDIENVREKQACESALERAQKLCRAVMLARDLVNAPGNIKSPAYLAEQAQAAADESALKCKILGQKELAKEGCCALLGVAQGSTREPQLIEHFRFVCSLFNCFFQRVG